ncbi:hypothetical protein BX283_7758 [Streptomyces sp. TLI_146]|nr:hypothetical protein BX283_7758 [Streptomyces sp. TLI_146]
MSIPHRLIGSGDRKDVTGDCTLPRDRRRRPREQDLALPADVMLGPWLSHYPNVELEGGGRSHRTRRD